MSLLIIITENDFPWLNEIKTIGKAELANRLKVPKIEKELLENFFEVQLLMFEPFISIIFTFGGIYVLWSGVIWFKYIIMLSGIAMVLSFILSSIFILKESVILTKSV